jgi:hypothetical protein
MITEADLPHRMLQHCVSGYYNYSHFMSSQRQMLDLLMVQNYKVWCSGVMQVA